MVILSPITINSSSTEFANSTRMEIYEPKNHNGIWLDSFKADSSQNTCLSAIVEDAGNKIRVEDTPRNAVGTTEVYEQEADKPSNKVLRRLAQNREAARKSRLRKKAYVQQLESSRIKLAQVEQELKTTKQQGMYISGHAVDSNLVGFCGTISPGVAAFEMEYGHWVEEQNRHICELRAALQTHVSEIELQMLVESGMNHYYDLFRIKAIAAKSDVFYLMSGLWRTTSERFFLWIGGFRPSELLKVLTPQLDPLTEQQVVAVCNLQQSSQQAEDALSQGLDKLQQTLSDTLTTESLSSSGVENYMGRMANAMDQLEALVGFVNQADHLRQQTMQQMYKILTTRQVARGLLALGDYFQRLRALSSLWEARPREPA